MEEVVEGEHRALLFSQSTQMLNIIEDFFRKWRLTSIRLDGSTPPNQRSILVDEFNRNSKLHCFLLSTKAGGTGLNLTGADTVIFYDHDWNPANDKQAQDRAYRIGQTKPVTVYRLISKGTIEEKIIERQAIKQSLADEIIGADEEGFKDLTKDELLALFKLDDDVE
jgi:E1A-binding protein p400